MSFRKRGRRKYQSVAKIIYRNHQQYIIVRSHFALSHCGVTDKYGDIFPFSILKEQGTTEMHHRISNRINNFLGFSLACFLALPINA